ncbi:unnamed protein product [Allacma fusca]|uniref:Uncharacterized protein n=1 Tax=Allacma fusca TaxID=39272 RepID=A0A8J2MH76_9HEXA|nr:unnamed protein product [Allacma fusca]
MKLLPSLCYAKCSLTNATLTQPLSNSTSSLTNQLSTLVINYISADDSDPTLQDGNLFFLLVPGFSEDLFFFTKKSAMVKPYHDYFECK